MDLLEALKQSRKDAENEAKKAEKEARKAEKEAKKKLAKEKGKSVESLPERSPSGWLGDDTVPVLQFSDLPHPAPALPPRPSLLNRYVSDSSMKERAASVPQLHSSALGPPPTLPVPQKQVSRSPSPDQNRKAMRTTLRPERKGFRSSRSTQNLPKRPAPMKAAGLAWDTRTSSQPNPRPESDSTIEARLSATAARRSLDSGPRDDIVRMPDPQDYTIPSSYWRDNPEPSRSQRPLDMPIDNLSLTPQASVPDEPENPPPPPPHLSVPARPITKARTQSPTSLPKPPAISYRKEFPARKSDVPPRLASNILDKAYNKQPSSSILRKPVGGQSSTRSSLVVQPSESDSDTTQKTPVKTARRPQASRPDSTSKPITPPSTSPEHSDPEENAEDDLEAAQEDRSKKLLKNLPRGIDLAAARSILNEIIVRGDEVHWEDVAGLELAKTALKEAVVYPFLRPDLFLGLREPARGMLLFGPPGTGKTMLARAVATESKSTFFAISASSLTSKWHGESEKLVRALFSMAKVMSPSIIFVDEIDSLLSKRGEGSEHEASRRSKTEFLIQWSDLQKAAAGKESDKSGGDPTRVLVLAATNCPWDIDDAARRRFVRRQYIPLPEDDTREKQLRTLLGHQKHELSEQDVVKLVEMTDGKFLS